MHIKKNSVYVFIYVFVFILLFPFLTYYLIETSSNGRGLLSPTLVVLGSGVTMYAAARIISLARYCPQKMTVTVFYIFVYIWLGLTPLYQLGVGQIPWGIVLSTDVYEKAYFVVLLAIAAFEVGYGMKIPVLIGSNEGFEVSRKRIFLFSYLAIALALWFGPISQPLLVLVSFREDVAAAMGQDALVLVKLSLMRTPIYVALLVIVWKLRTTDRKDAALIALLILVLPVFVIANFPTAVSRAWLGALIISIVLVFLLTSRARNFLYVPLLLPVGLLTVFPFMHRFRRADFDSEGGIAESVLATYSRGDFDVFSMTAHFVNYVDSFHGIAQYGRQLLGALFFWVPRTYWSGKPVGSGYYVAEQSGFHFFNVSAPLWAEGLINFSFFGVVLFMAMLGIFLRRLDLKVVANSRLNVAGLIYVFVSGFLFIILRGDLNTVVGFIVPFLFCVLFVGYRCDRKVA